MCTLYFETRYIRVYLIFCVTGSRMCNMNAEILLGKKKKIYQMCVFNYFDYELHGTLKSFLSAFIESCLWQGTSRGGGTDLERGYGDVPRS